MNSIKTFLCAVLFVLLTTSQSASGQVKIGIYSGLGISSFEDMGTNGNFAEMLPLGLQVFYSLESIEFVSFNFGVDFNYSVIPFTFEAKDAANKLVFTTEQNQLHVGVLVKIKFIKEIILNPYVRLGTGLYSGGHLVEFSDEVQQAAQQQQISLPNELDISSGFGFNFGGGVDLKLTSSGNFGLFLEFVYHLNSRELDRTPYNIFGVNLQKKSLGFDNYAILLGFQVGF